MSFLSRLFGRGTPSAAEAGRDVEALAQPLSTPAVHAVHCREQSPSHLGGSPVTTPDQVWPSRDGRPLAFLARIDLTQVQRTLAVEWLPAGGALLFFYDVAEQPWGFDPTDREGWRVVYIEKPDGLAEMPFPPTLDVANRLPRQFLAFHHVRSYPSCERDPIVALHFDGGERDRYCDLQLRAFGDRPRHQLAGYPTPIQNDDMESESELASNGIDLGESGAGSTPRAMALRDRSSEWRLLFQVDSDDAIDMMWGDVGTIYFWIRESDARAGRFEGAWLILQCH
jgi:uncharacterized protein YwqG